MRLIYAIVLVGEFAYLLWRFSTNPPAPSDPFNVWLGTIGLASMVAMLVYSVARRWPWMRRRIQMPQWLDLHIFLGVQGVMLVLFHSASLVLDPGPLWINPGLLNLIGVILIFLSGIFGRFLYGRLPRKLSGELMVTSELGAQHSAPIDPTSLPEDLARMIDLTPPSSVQQLLGAVWALRSREQHLTDAGELTQATRELLAAQLEQVNRVQRLRLALRMFQNWIILHRPMAAAVYIISVVHVVVALMYSNILTGS